MSDENNELTQLLLRLVESSDNTKNVVHELSRHIPQMDASAAMTTVAADTAREAINELKKREDGEKRTIERIETEIEKITAIASDFKSLFRVWKPIRNGAISLIVLVVVLFVANQFTW